MTKPTKWSVHPAKTHISLGIRPVWSESSLSAWRKLGSLATHWVHSQDSDQTAQADLSFRWAHRSFCWFCHEAAHFTCWKWGFDPCLLFKISGCVYIAFLFFQYWRVSVWRESHKVVFDGIAQKTNWIKAWKHYKLRRFRETGSIISADWKVVQSDISVEKGVFCSCLFFKKVGSFLEWDRSKKGHFSTDISICKYVGVPPPTPHWLPIDRHIWL